MERAVRETHELARRYARPYGLILFDVDHFKAYNDHYGHPSGDRVLVEVAASLLRNIRSVDRLFRYGGEELVALLPETRLSGAEYAAERLRSVVAALAIAHESSASGIVTVSAGVSGATPDAPVPTEWQAVLRQADAALYQAKNAGRDRVVRAASGLASGAVPT
jgi:diguanylate cyclase (GGDEF)-like protein